MSWRRATSSRRPRSTRYISRLTMQQRHDRAKRELVDVGWPSAALDRMPHVEIGLLHGLLEYDRYLDEAAKWHNLPYWQGASAVADLAKRKRTMRGLTRPDAAALALPEILGSQFERIYYARTRVERRIAALRIASKRYGFMELPTKVNCRVVSMRSRWFLFPSIRSPGSRSSTVSLATRPLCTVQRSLSRTER